MSDDKDGPDSNEDQKAKEEAQDNVIRFPVERVKSRRKLKKLAGKMGDNRKTTLFLSLLSVLVMSAVLLQQMSPKREVASNDLRDREKEGLLAERLNSEENRDPASYGRKPTSEEKLMREVLNGRYRALRDNDTGMVFEAVVLEGMEPIHFNDIERKYDDGIAGFLYTFRDTIHPGYDSSEPYADPEEANLLARVYLLKQEGVPVATVRFELNQSEHLISIKVQAIQKP